MEGEKKLNELSEKIKLLLTKGYNFLLRRMHFTGNDGYQHFQVFTPMVNLLI